MKRALVFIAVGAVCLLAASHRFGDSAHAMGMISAKGGKARHPVHLPAGKERYTLIVTATVLPPYSGNARVTVKGQPHVDFSLHATAAILDLGLKRTPELRDSIFHDLRPRDRLSMWVVIKAPEKEGSEPGHGIAGRYTVAFEDLDSGRPVLEIPVIIGRQEGGGHDH